MSLDNAPLLKPRSDLGIRTISGVAMMSVAVAAIWYGGVAFVALVAIVGLGVLFALVVIGGIVIFVKYHDKVFDYVKTMNTLRATQGVNNPIVSADTSQK